MRPDPVAINLNWFTGRTVTDGISMIRPAKKTKTQILTKLPFESKGYWGYPKAYCEIWQSELTITSDYIEKNGVLVFESEVTIVGYYSIIELKDAIEVSGVKIEKAIGLNICSLHQITLGEA
jgi:hypothetical protein